MATWKTVSSRVLVGFAVLFALLALVVVAAMVLVKSGWAERRLEELASQRLNRAVDIEGQQVLAAWPPQVELASLRIANPEWAEDEWFLQAEGISATLHAGPLLRGRFVVSSAVDTADVSLQTDGDRATWHLGAEDSGDGRESSAEGGRGDRFTLHALSVGDLELAYRDPKDDTDVLVHAQGDLGREGQGVMAEAEGRFRGEPLAAQARAPAIPLSGDEPVEVSFEVELAKTRTAGNLAIRATTDALKSVQGHIEASGPSIAAFKRVMRGDLPSSAPYEVVADVKHEDGVLNVENLRIALGKSDVQGAVSVDTTRERPFVRASLKSESFDMEETGLKTEAKEELQEKYLIPRTPWPSDKLEALDAEIDLQIKKVRNAQPVPFDALSLKVVLENSSLKIDPFKMGLASGSVSGRLALDAAESPERASARIEIRGLALSRLFPEVKQKDVALGRLNGLIELSGRGDTPAALMGSADGRLLFAAERGTASGLLIEVLGLDAAEAVMLLGKQKKPLPLRCAVVDLKVKNGVATPSPFVIDASDSVLSVEGTIDLGKERLDLKARAEPRDASPFTLRTPVNITGTFLDPKVRPQPGPLAGRAGSALLLGAINPLLALIPFVDPGGDPEGGCQPQKR